MKVYGMSNTRSLRVTWALEEAGLPYEYQLINLLEGDGNSPEFLAVNPSGKVPAIEDDGFVLTESSAICTYIARKAPEKKLAPLDDDKKMAAYDQWCTFAVCELEQPLWTRSRHTFVYPEEQRVAEILETTLVEYKIAIDVLEKGLGDQDYLMGAQFTMADILTVQTLLWADMIEIPLESKTLQAYKERAIARAAFSKAAAFEAEKMPG